MIDIGGMILKYRVIKVMKQSTLALELGVSDQTISKWERGHTEPNVSNFIKLCSVLDIPQELFFSDFKLLKAQRLISESSSSLQECIFNVDDEITIKMIESCLSELILISKRI